MSHQQCTLTASSRSPWRLIWHGGHAEDTLRAKIDTDGYPVLRHLGHLVGPQTGQPGTRRSLPVLAEIWIYLLWLDATTGFGLPVMVTCDQIRVSRSVRTQSTLSHFWVVCKKRCGMLDGVSSSAPFLRAASRAILYHQPGHESRNYERCIVPVYRIGDLLRGERLAAGPYSPDLRKDHLQRLHPTALGRGEW